MERNVQRAVGPPTRDKAEPRVPRGVAPRRASRSGRFALLAACGALGVLTIGASTAQAIPDDRVYELVSPGTDEGPGYDSNVAGSGVLAGVRASSTDDAVAYQTLQPGTSSRRGQIRTYAARRTADGWVSQKVSPESVTDSSLTYNPPRFTAFDFTDDISKGLFTSQVPADQPVVPGEPEKAVNLYLQDLATSENLLLTPVAPVLAAPTAEPPAPRVAWASSDLENVVFDVKGAYFEKGPGSAVYAWSAKRGTSIASILPDGKVASTATAGYGPAEPVDQALDFSQKGYYGSDYGAISEDGSRIYFTGSASIATGSRIFVRRDHGTRHARTVELALPESGLSAVPAGNTSRFRAASKDGHRMLFTSCGKLTADSTAIANQSSGSCSTFGFTTSFQYPNPAGAVNTTRRPELYLYDEDANGGAGGMTDLTTGDANGAGVLGIVALTEDLSRIYFAATGVLAPGGTLNKANLYVWDENDGTSFVGPLLPKGQASGSGVVGDELLWASTSSPRKNAYMTPDGKYLAFSTYAKVDPSFDNRQANGSDILRQIYLYTYGEGRPVCVSCASSGRNRSEGTIANQRLTVSEMSFPAIANWTKRSMTDDGRELYFESADALVPTDRNSGTDVFVYRPENRRIETISTGKLAGNASFAGASADGLNVFFRSEGSIAVGDTNAAPDLYTARLRRGDQVPEKQRPIDPCQGSACPSVPPSTILGPSTNLPVVPGFEVAEVDGPMRSTWRRTGKVVLPVTTPGAGTISVTVRGTIRTTVKAKKAKAKKATSKKTKRRTTKKAKPKYKIVRATVARATIPVAAAGRHGVMLRLTKAARAQLERTRKLSLTVDVRFGAAHEANDVKLVLPKKKTTKKKSANKKKSAKKKAPAKKRATAVMPPLAAAAAASPSSSQKAAR